MPVVLCVWAASACGYAESVRGLELVWCAAGQLVWVSWAYPTCNLRWQVRTAPASSPGRGIAALSRAVVGFLQLGAVAEMAAHSWGLGSWLHQWWGPSCCPALCPVPAAQQDAGSRCVWVCVAAAVSIHSLGVCLQLAAVVCVSPLQHTGGVGSLVPSQRTGWRQQPRACACVLFAALECGTAYAPVSVKCCVVSSALLLKPTPLYVVAHCCCAGGAALLGLCWCWGAVWINP